MPVHDIATNLNVQRNIQSAISSNTTTAGNSVDTKDYELGYMLTAYANIYTDGTYVVTLTECATSGGTYTAVAAANYVNGVTSLTISAINSAGAAIGKLGVFGTMRYLKPSVVSTSVTTGATLQLLQTQAAELAPTT